MRRLNACAGVPPYPPTLRAPGAHPDAATAGCLRFALVVVIEHIVEHETGGQSVAFAARIAAEHAAETARPAGTATSARTAAATRSADAAAESARPPRSAAAALALVLRRGRFTKSPRPADAQVEVELSKRAEVVDRDDFHAGSRVDHEVAVGRSKQRHVVRTRRELLRARRTARIRRDRTPAARCR